MWQLELWEPMNQDDTRTLDGILGKSTNARDRPSRMQATYHAMNSTAIRYLRQTLENAAKSDYVSV